VKAVVYTRYGSPDVLELRDVPRPVPRDYQVLVSVRAASVNFIDWIRCALPPLYVRLLDDRLVKSLNTILGVDLAGRVEAVGASVTRFRPGDEVFGLAAGAVGAFAEYACAAERSLALKPTNVSFEAAAAVPNAGMVALQGLRDKGQIRAGQRVLVYGASGGIGTFAVQIAKAFGAEVTAICRTRNLDLARSVGADHVIDYTRDDFTQTGQRYDLIAAVNGYRSILAYRRALAPGGTYVMVGGTLAQALQAVVLGPLLSRVGTQRMTHLPVRANHADLVFLAELLQAGKLEPVIDRHYPLSETAAAIRYLIEAHARGKVIITVDHTR
jgi:NADPH:quinone reductase-like Zn-dependent oxidoreductase